MALDFGARAQDFLKRITHLSADLATRGRTRTLALQKLHRICQAEVRTLKARYTLVTVKLALSKYRNAIRAVEPDHLVLRPRKMRSGQRFSYLALDPEETRALNNCKPTKVPRTPSPVRMLGIARKRRLDEKAGAKADSRKTSAASTVRRLDVLPEPSREENSIK